MSRLITSSYVMPVEDAIPSWYTVHLSLLNTCKHPGLLSNTPSQLYSLPLCIFKNPKLLYFGPSGFTLFTMASRSASIVFVRAVKLPTRVHWPGLRRFDASSAR